MLNLGLFHEHDVFVLYSTIIRFAYHKLMGYSSQTYFSRSHVDVLLEEEHPTTSKVRVSLSSHLIYIT